MLLHITHRSVRTGRIHNRAIAGLKHLLHDSWVRTAIVLWLLAHCLVLLLAPETLPLHRPRLEGVSVAGQLVSVNTGLAEVLVLIGLTIWMTRRRSQQTIAVTHAAVAGSDTRRETALIVGYGALALLGGITLGEALGLHPISFHLAGTLFGSHQHDLVSPRETFIWAGYNVAVYAIVPLLWMRRSARDNQILLRSHDRRGDIILIATILAIESLVQLSAVSTALFDLTPHQLLFGAPLTFGLYFLGTVLPTMLFVEALLVPRFLALTGSAPRAVLLGGIAYATMHFPEAWMSLNTGSSATVSLIFLMFTYFAPGMVKATLTLRTGNAWVHVWAYHAIAPPYPARHAAYRADLRNSLGHCQSPGCPIATPSGQAYDSARRFASEGTWFRTRATSSS